MTAPTHSGEITDLGSALAYVTASSNYCSSIEGTFELAQEQAGSTAADLQRQLVALEAAQVNLMCAGFDDAVVGHLGSVSGNFTALSENMRQAVALLATTHESINAAKEGLNAASAVFRSQMGLSEQVQSQPANKVATKTAFYRQGTGQPSRVAESCSPLTVGSPVMTDTAQSEPTEPVESPEPEDLDDDEENGEPEVYTTCLECDEPLETPTTREEDACHDDCDPNKPPKYWMGALARGGKKIDRNQAEPYRRLKGLAEDVFDLVLEWETPYGDTFISFPDGSIVDAREWIERPENLELAGGRDQYAGRGEFDPSAPDRCWLGQTLPSGRMARPVARSYEDVADLAEDVCKRVYEGSSTQLDKDNPYTVMLPGGQLVDAYDWAQRPETRQLAGYAPVEFDASAPDRCWIGQTTPDGPIRQFATPYEDVADLATHVCREIFDTNRISSRKPFTVMLPGGQLVDAYDWAQRPETRQLAGRTTVRNRVRFVATAACDNCKTSMSSTVDRIIQGEIGAKQKVSGPFQCDTCDEYATSDPVLITLVDDASASSDAPPRLIGEVEPGIDHSPPN